MLWTFWLEDNDRATAWDPHGKVLQYVGMGHGETPAAAWEDCIKGNGDTIVVRQFEAPHALISIPYPSMLKFSTPDHRS